MHKCTMALDPETLLDLEADAAWLIRAAGLDDDTPPSMDRLCVHLTGHAPTEAPRSALRGAEGCLARVGIDWRVFVSACLTADRRRWVVGHELRHAMYRTMKLQTPESERACDAFGAMVAVPRRAMLRAIALEGHSVTRLATLLRVPEALVLLRLGEVVGRPVALVRPPVVARGEAFPWPEHLTERSRVDGAHPVRLASGWGFMARAA